jgi:hypothetical protein
MMIHKSKPTTPNAGAFPLRSGPPAPTVFSVTVKGKVVLQSPTRWGLSSHLRDLLTMCDPQMRLEHARQCLPPESLHMALYALQQLELIEGPPIDVPKPRRLPAA